MLSKKSEPLADALAQRVRQIAQSKPGAVAKASKPAHAPRAARASAFKQATLTFTGSRMVVVIKNLSATGARVEFVNNILLPEQVLVSEPSTGLKKWACVTWQTQGAAGIEFVDAGPPTSHR